MTKRKKHQITEYEKCLWEYHKASPRHVIVLETDLTEDENGICSIRQICSVNVETNCWES